MNREILFKAKIKNWRKLPKKEWWVEGDLIQITFNGIKRMWISSEEHDNARLRYVHKYVTEWRAIEIDPDTLCQYTGLTDKYVNKIWENGILLEKHKGIVTMKYRVVFDLEEGMWMLETRSGARYGIGSINQRDFEVIGNIFDNPELLEVQEC